MCAHRSMTSTADTTMAASKAAGSVFKEVSCSKKSNRLKTIPVQKILVQRTHITQFESIFLSCMRI